MKRGNHIEWLPRSVKIRKQQGGPIKTDIAIWTTERVVKTSMQCAQGWAIALQPALMLC